MSDTRMVKQIAWWLHPDCWEDAEGEEGEIAFEKMARRIVKLVRDHDKRLTRRAADGSKGSAKIDVNPYQSYKRYRNGIQRRR